jgi:hypothetical protein
MGVNTATRYTYSPEFPGGGAKLIGWVVNLSRLAGTVWRGQTKRTR